MCQFEALPNDVFTQFIKKKKKNHKNYIFLERQDQDATFEIILASWFKSKCLFF